MLSVLGKMVFLTLLLSSLFDYLLPLPRAITLSSFGGLRMECNIA